MVEIFIEFEKLLLLLPEPADLFLDFVCCTCGRIVLRIKVTRFSAFSGALRALSNSEVPFFCSGENDFSSIFLSFNWSIMNWNKLI